MIPRDQANARSACSAATTRSSRRRLSGRRDQTLNVIGRRYFGLGYNADRRRLPDAAVPRHLRSVAGRSPPPATWGGLRSGSLDLTSAGTCSRVRLEEQKQENESARRRCPDEWAPRPRRLRRRRHRPAAAQGAPPAATTRSSPGLRGAEFGRLPNGSNLFDGTTGTRPPSATTPSLRRVVPVLNNAIQFVDPYYKDEATLGTEWQFAETGCSRPGQWWEVDDLALGDRSVRPRVSVCRDIRNWEDGYRDYRGLRLELSRAFRDGWTMMSNYTWGEGDGNNFGAAENVVTAQRRSVRSSGRSRDRHR